MRNILLIGISIFCARAFQAAMDGASLEVSLGVLIRTLVAQANLVGSVAT